MPSETDAEETALNANEVQVDVQLVLNSYARQISEMAGKVALLEARVETDQNEIARLRMENEGLHNALRAKPEHDGRTTKPPRAKGKK